MIRRNLSISIREFSTTRTVLQKAKSEERKLSHLEFLKNYYTDDLLESIKITESITNPKHYESRKIASVEFSPPYLDDFAKYDKFWDYAQVTDPSIVDYRLPLQPAEVPKLPQAINNETTINNKNKKQEIAKGLSALTGLSQEYIEKLHARPLVMKRVSNQTAKGKIRSNYALVAVGDKKGMIGIGEGKDREQMSRAIYKAHWNAVKNLTYIPRHENRTILSDIDHRFHGVKIFLRSAPPGFGLRVNHFIFELCELIGIKDLSGKIYKSRNGMNIVKGVVEALSKQKTLQEMSLTRGKKIVDLRRAYFTADD